MMDLRIGFAATAVTIGCAVLVTARVAFAPGPKPLRKATPEERTEIAQVIAGAERNWANESAKSFPQDHWSQRDDFHGREYRKVNELVKEKGVRVEDILEAVDDDIHRRAAMNPESAEIRHARAVPCKPRPFYD